MKHIYGDVLFYYHNPTRLNGPLAVYVANSISTGLKTFNTLTDNILKTFESKPSEYPTIFFAVINITKT